MLVDLEQESFGKYILKMGNRNIPKKLLQKNSVNKNMLVNLEQESVEKYILEMGNKKISKYDLENFVNKTCLSVLNRIIRKVNPENRK